MTIPPRATDFDSESFVCRDVAQYASLLHTVRDPIVLAMENLATKLELEIPDSQLGSFVANLVAGNTQTVLEVGTGIGSIAANLLRVLSNDSRLYCFEVDPELHASAHTFLSHSTSKAILELRLGSPLAISSDELPTQIDLLVLSDKQLPRLDLIDGLYERMAPTSRIVLLHTLPDDLANEDPNCPNRTVNRVLATDPRFTDFLLVPIASGVSVARICGATERD